MGIDLHETTLASVWSAAYAAHIAARPGEWEEARKAAAEALRAFIGALMAVRS